MTFSTASRSLSNRAVICQVLTERTSAKMSLLLEEETTAHDLP